MNELEVKKDLKQVADLYLQTEELVKDLEEQLREAKRELASISRNMLPEAMGSQTSASFGDIKISIAQKVYASLQAKTTLNKLRGEAYEAAWAKKQAGIELLNDKAPHLLKREVKVSLNQGDEETAKILSDLSLQKGYQCDVDVSIRPERLASWVKEYGVENLTETEKELLNVKESTEAKVRK